MRTRKVPYVSDIHCLLGSTIRDSGSQRVGTVVGINQYGEQPCIEVSFSDKQGIERVDLTREQLNQLIQVSRERLAAQPQAAKSVYKGQQLSYEPVSAEARRRA